MLLSSLNVGQETLIIVLASITGGVAIIWAIVFGVISVMNIAVRHRERMAAIGMQAQSDNQTDPLSAPPGSPRHPGDMRHR